MNEGRNSPLNGRLDNNGDAHGEPGNEGRVGLDIGLGGPMSRSVGSDEPGSGGSPFSLRHFLRPNHQDVGGCCVVGNGGSVSGNGSGVHVSSPSRSHEALPDFVQDHLLNTPNYSMSGFFPSESRLPGAAMSASDLRSSAPPVDSQGSRLPSSPSTAQASSEVGSSKSLPDFLSDGPIRSREIPQDQVVQAENERLQTDNERMRMELDMLRQQLSQQIQRSESLETEIERLRRHDESPAVGIVEKLENDLSRMTKRALAAENRVLRLKGEIESIRNQMRGGNPEMASTSAPQTQAERLASQLRNAAHNAEISLRHLLNGVDNLRHLAETLDPVAGPLPCSDFLSSGDSDSEDDFNKLKGAVGGSSYSSQSCKRNR